MRHSSYNHNSWYPFLAFYFSFHIGSYWKPLLSFSCFLNLRTRQISIMFLSSNAMMIPPSTTFPDLSLQISPPSASDFETKEVSCDGLIIRKPLCNNRSPTTESGSSGSDLSHENGFHHPLGLSDHHQPTLSLGFEMADLRNHPHRHHHDHQPQIYGREFKRSARFISGVKRSVRAPRMRWTTTLHAHFVHAVELLGGHESNIRQLIIFIIIIIFSLIQHKKWFSFVLFTFFFFHCQQEQHQSLC